MNRYKIMKDINSKLLELFEETDKLEREIIRLKNETTVSTGETVSNNVLENIAQFSVKVILNEMRGSSWRYKKGEWNGTKHSHTLEELLDVNLKAYYENNKNIWNVPYQELYEFMKPHYASYYADAVYERKKEWEKKQAEKEEEENECT